MDTSFGMRLKANSFIDWGNGLRFDPQNTDDSINPGLDYQQLISEGNLLLEQTTPGLAQDVAWPRNNSDLSERDITQLRFRLEFMQTYLEMRSAEYKLYFRKCSTPLLMHTILQEAIEVRGLVGEIRL